MRNYWVRILLGAFAIFAVGMIGVTIVRRGMSRVHDVVEGSGPLTIPLAFIPFSVEGERLGTLKRLVIHRPEPRRVSAVDVYIDVGDSLVAQGLSGCRLAASLEGDGPRESGVNVHVGKDSAAFSCLEGDSVPGDLEEFGQAVLEPGEIKIPLFLKRDLVAELQKGFEEDSAGETMVDADSIAEAAQAQVDSALAEADVEGKVAAEMGRRLSDSLRRIGLARLDSLRRADEMADSAEAP